ncbi:TPA: hypothetical protein DDZ86_02555 [Candidatus Dependentiae bacterium]|nr:MAG: Type 4 prepilin-like protein leader peptide-processing enzyme [candidate division TM6 bacterium GW2011_GWF2_43_87]HBL98500.1 hypothetical protein [Candidatus Dependentiae bacterium]
MSYGFSDIEFLWWVWGALVALCWGSFLNVIAFRLVFDVPFFRKRSHCPYCDRQLVWYELLPLISWVFLRGRCRTCKKTISWLYPLVEFLSLISFLALAALAPERYFFAYALFLSALIITIRTDIESLLIVRYCTLVLIPVGWVCAWQGWLPLSVAHSVGATIAGYAVLALVRWIFFWLTRREGMGQGDLELLATIGAFTGFMGVWASLFIASIFGALVGSILILSGKAYRDTPIPFGAFLALGAFMELFLSFCFHLNIFIFAV